MSWSDSLIKLATYEVENRQLRLAEIARRLGGGDGSRVEILLGGPGTGKTTRVATRPGG